MIDVRSLERPEGLADYKKALQMRGVDPASADHLVALNNKRKKIITEMEAVRSEQNKVGEEIAKRKRSKQDASDLMGQMQSTAAKVKELDGLAQAADEELKGAALILPNRLHLSVPEGRSAEDNQEVRKEGVPAKFAFKAKEHWELGEKLGILDFDRATKITGARFAVLKGFAAKMERALIQFMMDLHSKEHGYEEMIPPFIVNGTSMVGTGQFPKFRDDVFHLEGHDFHLVPTAEVPVTNYFAGEILKESDLPIQFCAYTPCFRSEAGSYGRDTRGLIRQHQFNKVELVAFAHPEKSYEMHEKLTHHAERVLQLLELPYRVMNLCSKDIGFGAAKCYDLEVWLPGQNLYREISSCSNFEDFQARRANIRFKSGDKGKPQFVHTLNGSGLAVGRTLIAIMENYQQEDGSIKPPSALNRFL